MTRIELNQIMFELNSQIENIDLEMEATAETANDLIIKLGGSQRVIPYQTDTATALYYINLLLMRKVLEITNA